MLGAPTTLAKLAKQLMEQPLRVYYLVILMKLCELRAAASIYVVNIPQSRCPRPPARRELTQSDQGGGCRILALKFVPKVINVPGAMKNHSRAPEVLMQPKPHVVMVGLTEGGGCSRLLCSP